MISQKRQVHSFNLSSSAFSILELVVVLSILGILTSISIPSISNFVKQSRIDGVKAKVNSTAADCLQKLRSADDSEVLVDPNIVSNEILKGEGYKISSDGNECSFFAVEPIDTNETFLFPMSFGITAGKLTKFAEPRGEDSLQACKDWAGVNCKESEELKELIAYNKSINAAKQQCEEQYSQWINAKSSGAKNRWNPAADSQCSSAPPKKVSPTCTSNGCNRKVYALDGTVVGFTKEDYDKAIEEKFGRICTEKLEDLRNRTPPFTNPSEQPITFTECGPQKFWFYKGKEIDTQEEWTGLKCDENTNAVIATGRLNAEPIPFCGSNPVYVCDGIKQLNAEKYQQCIEDNESRQCRTEINNLVLTRPNGVTTHPANGRATPPCGETFWVCNKAKKSSLDEFEAACGQPEPTPPPTTTQPPTTQPPTTQPPPRRRRR